MRLKKKTKFKSVAICEDGYRFPSLLEARRYKELKLLTKAKGKDKIYDLAVHPKYPIFVGNAHICMVELDFQYRDVQGTLHLEDTKGMDTALSKLKRKLVEAVHNVRVELVR